MATAAVRRLAALGAMVLTAGGLVGATSAPAQAAPDPDGCQAWRYIRFDGAVYGVNQKHCDYNDATYTYPVAIQQQDPVSGTWFQVAYDANGFAVYNCAGNEVRNYRLYPLTGYTLTAVPC